MSVRKCVCNNKLYFSVAAMTAKKYNKSKTTDTKIIKICYLNYTGNSNCVHACLLWSYIK